jgi:hypothetical protein
MKALSVAWHTVKNCIRQPFYLIAFLFTAISAMALPVLSQFSLYDQHKMLLDSLYGLILIIGILLNVLINEYNIGNDFSHGRALLLFSKPIGLINYTLGKLLGHTTTMVIYLIFSWLVLINMQGVVIQNFFFNYYKFITFSLAILLSFLMGALTNYFFRKNFSMATLCFILIFLGINTSLWFHIDSQSAITPNLLMHGKIFTMMSFFILFLGALANPVAVKLKSLGILIYTILILMLGVWIPQYMPSINDYWLVDNCYTKVDYSYSFIFQAFLNITIYSLFSTTMIYAWLRHTQLAKH